MPDETLDRSDLLFFEHLLKKDITKQEVLIREIRELGVNPEGSERFLEVAKSTLKRVARLLEQ